MKVISISLTPREAEQLKLLCELMGMRRSDTVRHILRLAIDRLSDTAQQGKETTT